MEENENSSCYNWKLKRKRLKEEKAAKALQAADMTIDCKTILNRTENLMCNLQHFSHDQLNF